MLKIKPIRNKEWAERFPLFIFILVLQEIENVGQVGMHLSAAPCQAQHEPHQTCTPADDDSFFINLINFEDEFIAADKIVNYRPQQNSLRTKLVSVWAESPGREGSCCLQFSSPSQQRKSCLVFRWSGREG